jgi:hypothetical protein
MALETPNFPKYSALLTSHFVGGGGGGGGGVMFFI